MNTIWKYPIELKEKFYLLMPKGAKVLHVGMQDGKPQMWAEVDPCQKRWGHVEREFYVVGSGQSTPEYQQHLGTWLDGIFVWHLYG